MTAIEIQHQRVLDAANQAHDCNRAIRRGFQQIRDQTRHALRPQQVPAPRPQRGWWVKTEAA